MKIAAVTGLPMTHPAPFARPAKYLHESPMSHLFVRVDTDEGITGYGEVSDSYCCSSPLSLKAIIEEALTPLLLGEDATAIDPLVVKMRGRTRRGFCDQGAIIQAISGVENALWDAVGKSQGKSVSRLLGRFRDDVPVYASGTFLDQGPAEFHLKLFEPCLNQGVRAFKVRIGPDYKRDLVTLRSLRTMAGDEIDIMVDGSENFSATSALEVAKALADLGVLFFEEPVPQHSRLAIAQLVEKSPLPIAYGEHLFTIHDFEDWLSNGRANVAQPDAAISGGIAECRRIAALAESFGVRVVPHSAAGPLTLAANLHLCAAAPNVWMLEYAFTLDRLWSEMLLEPILSPGRVRDGKLAVPDGPGLGLAINDEIWERYPYKPRATVQAMLPWAQQGHA